MALELNEYQRIAMNTAIYADKIIYPTLKLCGEAGEVSEKIGKILRDKGGLANLPNITSEDKAAIALELGDVMWYIAAISRDLGYRLEDVAKMNIGKLHKRFEEGKIGGSGDYR